MSGVHVNCPSCGATLAVGSQTGKHHIRCGRCKHKFEFPSQTKDGIEDVVASWLTDEEETEPGLATAEMAAGAEAPAGSDPIVLDGEDPGSGAQTGGDSAAAIGDKHLRVVSSDNLGVLLEFSASRLLEPAFRAAFPRQCMSCDLRAHLRAHVVIFSQQLVDSVSMEAEHSAGTLVLSNEEVRGLSGQEILDRLPRVPNVPPPGDLPMPYWVCDMCSGSGTVSGQIQVNRSTGQGLCRLFIRNPRRGLEFVLAAGGESTEGYRELKERVDQTGENPWDSVPEVVQHRVQQWFVPEPGEVFLAYVPDRDYARTEDGMAGVLLSSTRMIHHTPRRHHQCSSREPMELQHASGAGKGSITIKTASWAINHMSIDREGITRLRRGLLIGKFRAVWR